MNGNETTEVIQ